MESWERILLVAFILINLLMSFFFLNSKKDTAAANNRMLWAILWMLVFVLKSVT